VVQWRDRKRMCVEPRVTGLNGLVLLRLIWGGVAAGLMPMTNAWVGDALPYEPRQATLARLLRGFLGGMSLGQLADSRFGVHSGAWRCALLVLAPGRRLVAVVVTSRMNQINVPCTPVSAADLGVPSP
jgi:MFS family permease